MELQLEDNLTRFVFERAAVRGAAVLFPVDDVRAFRPRVPRFGSCSCPRVAAALERPDGAGVGSILAERTLVGASCEFCDRRYEFGGAQARALFAEPPAASVLR